MQFKDFPPPPSYSLKLTTKISKENPPGNGGILSYAGVLWYLEKVIPTKQYSPLEI